MAREESYKNASAASKKKDTRVRRRSSEWREQRNEVVNARRNCIQSDISPVLEVDESDCNRSPSHDIDNLASTPSRPRPGSDTLQKPQTPLRQKKRDAYFDRYQKYLQAKRDRKTKEKSEKKKPQFKVCKVRYDLIPWLPPKTQTDTPDIDNQRITRSRARAPDPKSAQAAPKSAQAAPKSAQAAPKSAQAALKSAQGALKSALVAPQNVPDAQSSSRTSQKTVKGPPGATASRRKADRPVGTSGRPVTRATQSAATIKTAVTKSKPAEQKRNTSAKSLKKKKEDSTKPVFAFTAPHVTTSQQTEIEDFSPISPTAFTFRMLSPNSLNNFFCLDTTSSLGSPANKRSSTPNRPAQTLSETKGRDTDEKMESGTETEAIGMSEEGVTKDFLRKSERRHSRRSLRIASQRAENVAQSDSFESKQFPAENPTCRATSPETAVLDMNHTSKPEGQKSDAGEEFNAETVKADVASPIASVGVSTPVPRRRQSARRSLSHSIAATKSELLSNEVATGAEGSSQPETDGQLPGTPSEDLLTSQPRGRRSRSRKSMSAAEEFRVPSPGSTAKRSGKNRSKSAQRRDDKKLPRSPEEWIQVLESSPMVEMTRRKLKTPRGSQAVSMTIDFDELDLSGPVPEPRAMEEEFSASDSFIQLTGSASGTLTLASLIPTNENPEDNKEKSVSAEDTTQKTPVRVVPAEKSSTPVQTLPATKPSPSEGSGDDVKYFRDLLTSETQRFHDLCVMWENISASESPLTEEVTGEIRTTIGQAQLLMAQRFKQFSGLVDNCEFGTGEKETTCSDLQGFWDMIYYQVEDVHNKFEDLRKLKAANWMKNEDTQPTQIKAKPKTKVVKNPVKCKPAGKSKFAAFRAQMMKKKKKENTEDKDNSDCKDDNNMKVFDAGFFKVCSPKKSPQPHCAGGTPCKVAQSGLEETPSQKELPKPSAILSEPSLPVTPVINRTPRRSYVPVVPSPLLCDITPSVKNKPSFRCTPKSLKRSDLGSGPTGEDDDNVSPVKRRRSRANGISVSVSDLPEPTTPYDSNNTPAQDVSENRAEDETGRQAKSALKKSRRSGTRKSARLSVHFDARTEDTGPSVNMPRTPVNRNSRVSLTRVRSGSFCLGDWDDEETDIFKDAAKSPADVSGKENLPVSQSTGLLSEPGTPGDLALGLSGDNTEDETGRQAESALKKSRRSGTRKSARLSVHFDASTEDNGPSVNMPRTPVNRNSRVSVTRVRSSSFCLGDWDDEETDIFKDAVKSPADVSGKENLPVSKSPFKQVPAIHASSGSFCLGDWDDEETDIFKDAPKSPADVSGKENLPVSKSPFKQGTSAFNSPLATNNSKQALNQETDLITFSPLTC